MNNDRKIVNNVKRISLISRIVRLITIAGLCLFLLSEFLGGISLELGAGDLSSVATETFPMPNERLGRLPFQVSIIGSFYWLFRLFGYFQNGEIFSASTVRATKLFSVFVMMAAINSMLKGFYTGLIKPIFVKNVGISLDINIHGTDLVVLGFGLLLYVFSLVQREAKTQTEDLRLIF